MVVQEHADVAGLFGGGCRVWSDAEGGADGAEEGLGGMAVEVFDEAVVGKDAELICGEEHTEEPVIVFGALVVGVGASSVAAYANGAGCAVMSIGDVGNGDLLECVDEWRGVGDAPDAMGDAVWGGEIDLGRGGEGCVDQRVDGGGFAVGEEDGAGIGAEGSDEAGSIVFFIFSGFFVFFDDVVLVVLDVANGGEAGLDMVAHLLLVEVEDGGGFALEGAVRLHLEEPVSSGLVDDIGVGVGFGGEVDFCTVDVHEAMGVTFG